MATKPKRIRDTKREYQARLAYGKASGKSRAQSRGHARAQDLPVGATAEPIDANNPLEKALKLMKQGTSQKQAAKTVGISTEKLRRYQKQNTVSVRQGRRWVISDSRPVSMVMATRGKIRTVTLSRDAGGDIGRHWVAINKFLETNDPTHLKPFNGRGLRDNQGLLHPFETRPKILRKLDSVGELSFVDIYRQTVQ
jgi:hypothetical protein